MFDDFDGPAGRLPDPAVWAPWLGADADYTSAHTDYPRNACLDGDGHLAITALREMVKDPRLGGRSVRYTTAMLTTQGRVERQYGTWSARIYLPPGKGHHPTFYLWGATYDPKTNPWPNCGEVDIIELQDTMQGSSIHGPGYDWLHGTQISVAAPLEVRGGWHTYTCRHEPDKLTIQIDGGLPVAVFTPAVLPKGKTWVFNQPLFAVLDLSVGTGTNKPDGQPFPIAMLVDWIRHEPLTEGDPVSKDDYARAVITEGQRRNITSRGIVIALATCLVESGLQMYANSKVPESLALPHDAVGSDGMSVGLFQQQVRKGANGQWWWADAATCMDPAKSAGLFYDRLTKIDYNGPNSPGSYAQAIQQSAFPDRYDQHMSEAQKIYDRLATGAEPVTDPNRPDFNELDEIGLDNGRHASVRSRPPVNFFLHTQEGDGNATDLSAYLRSTSGASAVSYHYTIHQAADGGVTVVDVVDTDLYSWSVLNANVFSINLCFAGSRAAWSRDQWLKQSKAIDVAAYLAVQDCRKYKFSTEVIAPPYGQARQGISDHKYVTQVLGIGNHTDVGNNFPWDKFLESVKKYDGGAVVTPQPVPVTPPPATWPAIATDRQLLEWLVAQLGPGDPSWTSKGATLRDKVWSLDKDAS